MTIYFYGDKNTYGEFSNFYPCEFSVRARDVFSDNDESLDAELLDKTISVYTSEQAIMWMKAVLMNDGETASSIEYEKSPKECKLLGRNVSPFDNNKWELWRQKIAEYVLTRKFTSSKQSKQLSSLLQSTESHVLAEAAGNDRIWGIGIDKQKALKGANWRGENILGKALMTVRDKLNNPDSN